MSVNKDLENLWVISEVFHPVGGSTGYIMTTIAIGLSKLFNVQVLTGPASYDNSKSNSDSKSKENYQGIQINRIDFWLPSKNYIILRLIRLSIISTVLFFKVLFKVERGAKVFMVTNPAPLLLIMSLLVKIKKLDLYLLVHDIYPDNLISAGLINRKGLPFHLIKMLFSYTYNTCKSVFVLGRDMQEIVSNRTSIEVSVIENWANLDLINPGDKDYQYADLPQELLNKTVFLYAGNIGRVQAIEFLCDIMNTYKDDERIAFIFAGGGAMSTYLEDFVNKNDLKNVFLTGPYLRQGQNKLINNCDIGIVSLSLGMYGLGVPCKTYNYMAGGKPIFFIGHEKSEIAQLVRDNDIGWLVNSGNLSQAKEVIDKILSQPKFEDKYKSKVRRLVESKYSENEILSKFRKAIYS